MDFFGWLWCREWFVFLMIDMVICGFVVRMLLVRLLVKML